MPDDPVLRHWRTSDAPALLRHLRGSADLAEQLPKLTDVAQARAWIQERQDEWYFAVVSNGVAIGNVSVGMVNRTHSWGWFSYWMAPAGRGKGWMQRAACTLADWALFDAPDPVYRLELGHRTNNPASGRVAAAAGFVQEGHEREKLLYHGVRYDTLTYSRLQTDPRPSYQPLQLEA